MVARACRSISAKLAARPVESSSTFSRRVSGHPEAQTGGMLIILRRQTCIDRAFVFTKRRRSISEQRELHAV